jgi:hypothetical protein
MFPFFKKKSTVQEPDSAAPGADRRKFPRVPSNNELDIQVEKNAMRIKVRDLSMGGIGFISPLPLDVSKVFTLHLDYDPVDFPLRLVILWNKPADEGEFLHGAEFVNVPKEEGVLLKDYIEALRKSLEEKGELGGSLAE